VQRTTICGVSTIDFTKEIDRGVELLNSYDPRWFDHINLDQLKLEDANRCVLGQLAMTTFYKELDSRYRNYYSVIDFLTADNDPANDCLTFTVSHGFTLGTYTLRSLGWFEERSDIPPAWEALTIQWAERIGKLRADAGTI
jgi:hypothetical protein